VALNLTNKTNDKVNWLRTGPIAHRGLHNPDQGVYENTLSAAKAALMKGYAIEVDLQLSSDGVPMVFHDYELKRMTGYDAKIREIDCKTLQTLKIKDTNDTIPTLKQLLDLIQDSVGIVLELKGLPGKDDGFVTSVASELEDYKGDFVIMSFHHHILEDVRRDAPTLPLGLTAEGDDTFYEQHEKITRTTRPDFISYELQNLNTKFVREFTETGRPAISWTIRNEEQAATSAKFVDQITFELFTP